jgi:hypothetical protein
MRFRAEPVLHGKVDTAKKSVVYKRFYHLFVEGELEVNPDKPLTQNLPNDPFAEGDLEVNHGPISPSPVTIWTDSSCAPGH